MPVSHLGLTVSHIPSATSFYLSALQPLGYRFIGHQGDSIGLGLDSADFFLTQAPAGTHPSPNHIAFLAENRLAVRDCYAAALTSGGLPSGAPSYRNDDCSCFNAAVEDLDGNTVEFIFRQPHEIGNHCEQKAPSENSRVLDWQKSVAESANDDDAHSVAKSTRSRGSLASKTSRAQSRMQTALDLASTASKSAKSASSSVMKSDFPSKTLLGTALGAAAGAALMFAMTKSESDNARDEAEHLAYMKSKSRRDQDIDEQRRSPAKIETTKSKSQAPQAEDRKSHRNYSTTESAHSRRQPPPETRSMRMIEATGYNRDDELQEVISRYNSTRPRATRSRTYDDYDYTPAAPSSSGLKRASTMPIEQASRDNYYLEAAPPQSSASRHRARGEEVPRSTVSRSSRHSHRRSSADEYEDLKRHDSGLSMHSHRSHREREADSSRRSSASTIKPTRRDHDNASKSPSSCYYPAAISLPPSKASSTVHRTPGEPLNGSKQSWEDFVPDEESDGLGDVRTVLPEDSISMVDFEKKPRRRKHHHSSSKHGSSAGSARRSEASTVKPINRGTVLPVREKGERRSVHV